MNQGQAQQAQGQSQAGTAGQQQLLQRTPMYQPSQIRSLPMLSEEEKNKYEQGLRGLWNKANNSPANSPDQIAARQKIIEFSKMLITKIQQRRIQAQQQAQQGQQGGQVPARPSSAQQNTPAQSAGTPAAQVQQKPQPPTTTGAVSQAQTNQAGSGAPFQNQKPQGAAAAGSAAVAAQRPKIPDNIMQHVNKMVFRAPAHIANKSAAEVTRWVEDIKDKYARAVFTMESSKGKVASMEKIIKDRISAGKPLQDEENRQYTMRKEQQLKIYSDAHKWVESVLKQQEAIQATQQQTGAATGAAGAGGQSNAPIAPSGSQQTGNTPATAIATQNTAQAATQNAVTSVNAAAEVARSQQQLAAANRPSPTNGTSTPNATQAQARPVPQPPQQLHGPTQVKTEQPHPPPPPVNTAQAQAAAARMQTPQTGTPVTAGGPTRALSHSAAMTLANQRAASTPGSAHAQGQQPANSSSAAGGPMNQAVVPGAVQPQQQQQQQQQPPQQLQQQPQPQQQQQQGHPHAHPTQTTQTQTGFQAKMPIPKQLPEKATAVPQGVSLGGGVSAGRPTMSQGSGTLGGVMNQPPVARIPAYSHDAEGDHVLSKKKLDELVRQVCGGSGDPQDGNLLTPDVEESVLNMADSFVDNVLHASCRNAKERGSKVLEIRDIQLVLERTYNIRVPGYSSDELRTVRKVQPSAGWIAKMSAVQAAKVMPGKGDT